MAKYTMVQKREAVRLYTIMSKEGTCYWKDVPIHNIRALCFALNISSQSLYRWAEVIDVSDEVDEGFEAHTPYVDEVMEVFESKEYDEGIFNGRFYAWLSAGLNIPYASKNAKATNMLKIGLELIKRSGLVDCDKVKKAMRV